ncbi:hypothetical protein K5_123 [Pseudomonas phage K5]|uniref:Uncharacterized protein n=4 Tax=Pakpunavirus TaxID=1921407 RepID=A0AAF0DSS1_9CAUD|nr:hypothetical protein PaP1_gp108 [Pseudomonas phage PaP1]YP_009200060.1 hypothetical protein K8_124 [Pseudomonas phage K8]YP_009273878.1 hypothetical protein BH773_gp105 [Pseudomonas phage K5]YP_010762068.1 hypothetical protein QE322_gp118 [Pseudomonas phage PaGz-1]YP_010762229.1 hypothetical protein QE323_gp073 [Pseudomonas phage SPA05]YP_010765009.1 hypothetical protein QE346_gp101 [Pseudomonas phage phipa10]WQZ01270.1 hypothetical protein [Pseudomonas phage Pae01]AEK21648.2 hypothetical
MEEIVKDEAALSEDDLMVDSAGLDALLAFLESQFKGPQGVLKGYITMRVMCAKIESLEGFQELKDMEVNFE